MIQATRKEITEIIKDAHVNGQSFRGDINYALARHYAREKVETLTIPVVIHSAKTIHDAAEWYEKQSDNKRDELQCKFGDNNVVDRETKFYKWLLIQHYV